MIIRLLFPETAGLQGPAVLASPVALVWPTQGMAIRRDKTKPYFMALPFHFGGFDFGSLESEG